MQPQIAPSLGDVREKIRAAANRLLTDPEWRRQVKEHEPFYRGDGHVWCGYTVATEDKSGTYEVELCPATGESRCGCRWHEFHGTCKHVVGLWAIKDGTAPTPPQMLPGLEVA